MYLSTIGVRWYRSFNTLTPDRFNSNAFHAASWNRINNDEFPFVTIDLDKKITTIVGANEAGKSHVLSAITKAFRSKAKVSEKIVGSYDKRDICRYCGFDHLAESKWPQFLVQLTAETAEERKALAELGGSPAEIDKVAVLIDGQDESQYARTFISIEQVASRTLTKAQWMQAVESQLPSVQIIAADKALASEVHVKQLLAMYANNDPTPAYDPARLQELADLMRSVAPVAGRVADEIFVQSYAEVSSKLEAMRIGPRDRGQLETILFRDVLQVPLATLNEIHALSSCDLPYIYRLVADIQRRIDERLELSRVWQQDPDLRLIVDFEGGFFYFRLTDRTGIKYAFDERSSGLKFFLSYYIQALGLERKDAKRGMIVLMDEPDGFLSATGQRDLLKIFDNLVDETRTNTRTQLIYTTHSPFLINKNYPHRARLVRKGDGAEGTQLVDRSAYRRFEPIRSALGIDFADTLFIGSQNVIVEGPSDQRLLSAGIQAFGGELAADSRLDLNSVVFVTAGGAPRMKQVILRSIGGTDDKLPVVVALFDGDAAGSMAYQEIYGEKILKKDYLLLLDQLALENADVNVVKVLEDLIPTSMLAAMTVEYLKSRWAKVKTVAEVIATLTDKAAGETSAERLKKVWNDSGFSTAGLKQDEFRASIVEVLAEKLTAKELHGLADLHLLKSNLQKIYYALNVALYKATAEHSRLVVKKRATFFVAEFRRSNVTRATKAKVHECLDLLEAECGGPGPELKQARDNVEALKERLNEEASSADASVDRDLWVKRLEGFAGRPWGN